MKNKLKHLKNITNLHLTEKDLELLYYLYEKTGIKGDFESIEKDDSFGITGDELMWALKYLYDHGLIRATFHSGGGIFRIDANGIQLIRSIEAEENKGFRDKILDRTNKQSPLRPFIAIIISIVALVVAICKN